MNALSGETGPAAEARKAQHRDQIRWYQHQITVLKAPAERVKSLSKGVLTAEKALLKAGQQRDEAKEALDAAQATFDQSLDLVVKANTDFQLVKEQLADAEEAVAHCKQ